MNSDLMTTLVSDLSRPSIAILCGCAIAGACFIPASAPIAIPVAGAVVMTYMGGKTYEKITSTKTDGVTQMATSKPSDVSVQGKVE
jgi:hypothetical protein